MVFRYGFLYCNPPSLALTHVFQIVFHVGAIRSLVGLSKGVLWEANVMATQNVLEQCLKKNVVRPFVTEYFSCAEIFHH